MTNLVEELQVYNGGHILNEAMVEYRKKQADEINGIIGIKCYNVLDDKSINDKANAKQEGLAERILQNDFKAMQESDIYVFDVLNEGIGTISELSILLGMKRQAQITIDRLKEILDINYSDVEGNITEVAETLLDEIKEQQKIIDKPVLIYSSDIREGNGHTYDDPYRTEVSFNQFIYGVILELTNGKGFMSWKEVKEELEYLGGN